MSLQIYLTSQNKQIDPLISGISGYNPGIPTSVIAKIDQLNQEKGPNSSMVLVLRSSYDPEPSALSGSIILSQFAHLSRSSRVFIQTLRDKGQIQPMISAAKKAGKVRALIFSTHAKETHLQIGQNSAYSLEDINESHFEDLPKNTPVIINACLTGQGFAPELAKRIKRAVHGAMESISCVGSLYFCKKHNSFEISHPVAYRIFKPDGSSEAPCVSYSERIPKLINIMDKYFNHWDQQNDHYSYKGLVYTYTSDYEKSFKCFLEGVNKNEGRSLTLAGLCLEKGLGCTMDKRKAFELYLKGAAQRRDFAHFSIGKFYEEGLGGCPQNIQLAIEWYQSAAKLGNSSAAARLTRLMTPYLPIPIAPVLAIAIPSYIPASYANHSAPLSSSSYYPLQPLPQFPPAAVPLTPYSAYYSAPLSSSSHPPVHSESLVSPSVAIQPLADTSGHRKRKRDQNSSVEDLNVEQPAKKICLEEEAIV